MLQNIMFWNFSKRHRKWYVKKVPKRYQNQTLGAQGSEFWVWVRCFIGLNADDFLNGTKIDNKLKNRNGDETKKRLCRKGRRQRRGPAEAFGISKSQQEFAKRVWNALSLQAGGGGFKGFAWYRRPQHNGGIRAAAAGAPFLFIQDNYVYIYIYIHAMPKKHNKNKNIERKKHACQFMYIYQYMHANVQEHGGHKGLI